uniref:Uncharacterized protein n=1 Tax=Aegilops tauschii subsp. strangulata TaxID=200361 RepID=A0A453L8G2_AEGTS
MILYAARNLCWSICWNAVPARLYTDTCLVSKSSSDSNFDGLAHSSGRFIYETIVTILMAKHMLQEWVHMTSCPSSTSYKAVLL